MTTARGIRGICLVATFAASIAVAAGVTAASQHPLRWPRRLLQLFLMFSVKQLFHLVCWIRRLLPTSEAPLARLKSAFHTPPDRSAPVYSLSVPSEDAVPGSGHDGALITFFVGTQQAPQIAVWHGWRDEHTDPIMVPPSPCSRVCLVPQDSPLGKSLFLMQEMLKADTALLNNTWDIHGAVVYSTDEQASRGTAGNSVTFKLLDARGNVVAVANQIESGMLAMAFQHRRN